MPVLSASSNHVCFFMSSSFLNEGGNVERRAVRQGSMLKVAEKVTAITM